MTKYIEERPKPSGAPKKKALLIVRTPFQAWLAEKVLEKESVSEFDIIYFTQNDAPEDQNYFLRLKEKAQRSKYVYVLRQKFDILNHLFFWGAARAFVCCQKYDFVMLASIESHVINSISNHFKACDLITFDDGTANYNKDSVYFSELESVRARLYRRILGGVSLSVLKGRIKRHYTIQPGMGNIVSGNRLFPVDGWECQQKPNENSIESKTYFLGAPFSEFLNDCQIKKLEAFVRTLDIDMYVRHPRERKPLNIGVPYLEKNGMIAEDAIIQDSSGGAIRLVGHLSSAIFNLRDVAGHRVVIVPERKSLSNDLAQIAKASGCEVVFLSDYF